MAHQASLTWDAPAVGTVASYNVKRGTAQTGPFATIGISTMPSFVDSDATLKEGVTYFYEVTAVGPGGESGASAVVSALIPFLVPSIPTNLVVKVS